MSLNLRKRMVLVKRETTYGTDAVPVVGTDALLCGEIDISPLNGEYKERNIITPYLGSKAKALLGKHVTISFATELAGMKALGVVVPALSALHRACGMAETIAAATKVDYTLIETGYESSTIYFNMDGVLHKITGARGNATFSWKANDYPSVKWEMTGLFNAVADAVQGSAVYTDFKEPVEVNSTNTTPFSLHGYSAAVLASLEINLGYQVKFRDFPGGGKKVLVTDRQSSGSISIEAETVAVKNWWSICDAVTQGALSLTHGAAGNQVVMALDATQLTEPKYGDSDGIATLDMGLNILSNTTGGMLLTYK